MIPMSRDSQPHTHADSISIHIHLSIILNPDLPEVTQANQIIRLNELSQIQSFKLTADHFSFDLCPRQSSRKFCQRV